MSETPRQPPSPGDRPGQAPSLPDPFTLWRQIYEVNEQAWNAALERGMANPSFAEASGKFMETFLAAQKTVRDNMRQYLETINVPTREDIARLGQLIVNLEEKIDQLDERLDGIEARLGSGARPTESPSAEGPHVILPGDDASPEGPQVIVPSGDASPEERRAPRPRTPRAGGSTAES